MKTLQKFAAAKPYAAPKIQTITISKRRKILLLSNGSEFLYLVVEDSLAVSISLRCILENPGRKYAPVIQVSMISDINE